MTEAKLMIELSPMPGVEPEKSEDIARKVLGPRRVPGAPDRLKDDAAKTPMRLDPGLTA